MLECHAGQPPQLPGLTRLLRPSLNLLCLLVSCPADQVTDFDAKLANFRNYRPLSKEAVLGHLADFGLEEVRCTCFIGFRLGGKNVLAWPALLHLSVWTAGWRR